MKHLRLTLLGLVLLTTFITGYAQTADEIIAKHLVAIGGMDAWRKVNSVYTEGNLKVQGADVSVSGTVLNGKGMRQNISVMGMTGFQIMTPQGGWNFMPFQGQSKPEPITAEDLKENADQMDTQGALVDYKQKGHSVEFIGKEDIEGTEAFKLRVTHKGGKVQTIFIDPASYYIIRSVSKQKANGQEMEIATNLSNYKKLPEGIVVPMSVSLPFGEMTITKVEINKPVDEKIFKPDNQ
jgi:hypothetical protein